MSQLPWAKRQFNLTQRAMLTLLGSMLVQAAEFLTGFFITPYIIRGLGQELYGAWGMIQQILAYFSMTDFRGPTTLRFLLSLKQHEVDEDSKQRLIGATLILWGICMPVTIALGIGLVYFASDIIRTAPVNQAPVRIALAVLLVNSVIDRVLAIPMHILNAQNMDYLGMGINTMMVLGGSLLSALAIWLGFGITGLAVATMFNVMLISNALPWMSPRLPDRAKFVSFSKTSAWLLFIGIGNMLTYTTGTMLVGLVLGPSTAAVYVTSGMVMSMIGEPMYQVISSGNPGLMGLCGQQNWERVAQVRKEMYFLLIFFMSLLGTGIIALNGAFLTLWVGPQFYGGTILTAGIVLSMVVLFLSRIDLLITDAMLFLHEKTYAFFCAGLIVVSTAVIFLKLWGINGMVVSTLLGNLFLLVIAWILIRRRMGGLGTGLFKSLLRPVIIMLLLFSMAYLIGPSLRAETWLTFLANTAVMGSCTLVISWLLVLPADIRIILLNRIKHNLPFLKKG